MSRGPDAARACAELRARGETTPILVLASRAPSTLDARNDRGAVAALEAGADDWVAVPFDPREVVARIGALVRRSSHSRAVRVGPIEVDHVGRRVRLDGEPLDLTSIEYRLLHRLASAGGSTVDRAALLRDVWGLRFDPGSGVLEVHVSRLRGRLGEAAGLIETVRGKGYRLRRRKVT